MSAAVFKFYLDLAKEKLNDLGCTSVKVEYSGEGESERTKNVIFTPAVDVESVKNSLFDVGYIHCVFDEIAKKWGYVVIETPRDLTLLIQDFCCKSLLASGNKDYSHGNGGGGTFSINVQTGAVQLAHYKNGVEREYSTFSINPQTGEASRETPEEDADAAETAPAAPSA